MGMRSERQITATQVRSEGVSDTTQAIPGYCLPHFTGDLSAQWVPGGAGVGGGEGAG